MSRQELITKITPKQRYTQAVAQVHAMPTGRYLFATTETNAGYFLITDDNGQLAPLDISLLGQLAQEARFYGVKLKNMRIFGSSNQIKRVPAGGRFYGIQSLEGAQ